MVEPIESKERKRMRSIIAQSFYLKYVEVWGKDILKDKGQREALRRSAITEADMFILALEETDHGV